LIPLINALGDWHVEEVREYFRLFERLDLLNEFLREID
jgi:hypothetical protein